MFKILKYIAMVNKLFKDKKWRKKNYASNHNQVEQELFRGVILVECLALLNNCKILENSFND